MALFEHGWQELVDERDQRVHGQRQVVPEALGRQCDRRDESCVRGGAVIEDVEVADRGADLLSEPTDRTGVGQIGGDDVCGGADPGEILGEARERFPAAGDEDDGVAVSRSDGMACPRPEPAPNTPMDLGMTISPGSRSAALDVTTVTTEAHRPGGTTDDPRAGTTRDG